MWNYNDELYHYGVKGMKWGVTRQKEATLARGAFKTSSDISREMSNIAGTIGKNRGPTKKQKKELSTMSDAELRAKVNRMNLEQQYSQLSASKKSKGAAVAQDFLSVAGSIAAIGASAATIAMVVLQARKK